MKRLLLLIVPLALTASPALAQDPNWTVDVGAVGRVRPTHLGSMRYTTDVVPVFQANYGDDLSLSLDDGARWSALKWGPLAFGPVAEYRTSFNDALPQGAFRMADAVELGGFASAKTPIGIVEARLRRAVTGYQGWSGDLAFDTGGRVAPKWLVGGELRLSWADSNFTREYFGLQPHFDQELGLPHFAEGDFFTAGGELDAARELTPKTRLVLALSADRMLGEMKPSPLFHTRDILTASVGLTWHWSLPPFRRHP